MFSDVVSSAEVMGAYREATRGPAKEKVQPQRYGRCPRRPHLHEMAGLAFGDTTERMSRQAGTSFAVNANLS